jgi:hypothetical protein
MDIEEHDFKIVKRNVLSYAIISSIGAIVTLLVFYITTNNTLSQYRKELDELKLQQKQYVSQSDMNEFKTNINSQLQSIIRNQENQTRQQDNLFNYLLQQNSKLPYYLKK